MDNRQESTRDIYGNGSSTQRNKELVKENYKKGVIFNNMY